MADRDAIFDYIEADNPLAAIAMDDRIRDHVDSLLRFPESGRPGRFPGNWSSGAPHTSPSIAAPMA